MGNRRCGETVKRCGGGKCDETIANRVEEARPSRYLRLLGYIKDSN